MLLSIGFLLGLAVAVVLSRAPGAFGATGSAGEASEDLVTCEVDRDRCQVANAAIDRIAYPWFVLGYEVHVDAPPDSWHSGMAVHGERRIDLYVDEKTAIDDVTRTFAHELAHVILHSCGDERLEAWRARRQLPGSVPDHVDAPHDFDSVSEDAAEAFAQYLTGKPSRSTVGDDLTDSWLQRNADLFMMC